MATRKERIILLVAVGSILIGIALWAATLLRQHPREKFDGQRAYQDVQVQMSFGPRTPGSEAHTRTVAWIQDELNKAGWQVEIQSTEVLEHPIQNIIARRGDSAPQIILGAHYDSRLLADMGSAHDEPVPGANDGASGVAVLLELARTLPTDTIPIWLVFFDAEDNYGIPGWSGELGSQAFVSALIHKPRATIIVDMIGDVDLNIFIERNSDPALTREIWTQAKALGYERSFIPTPKYSMIDDHTPFLEAGIQAAVIIDFDYPYWHTTADTADKVSATSLQAVGDTLLAWLVRQK